MTPQPDWWKSALCAQVDPELFFPEKGNSSQTPRQVCAACRVRNDCLDYALTHHITEGIWGGLNARQRRGMYYPREEQAS